MEKENNTTFSVHGTAKLRTQPVTICFTSNLTGKKIGEFKEVDGKLTFEGDLTESGKQFVDFVCKTFNK